MDTENEKSELILEYRLKVGNSLRDIRESRGYSQDHLADLMKVSRSTISKIENGKFSFSIDYLSKLSIFLDFETQLVEGS
jgi:transcriptional regulator with XRE-family HTH domain